MGFTAWPYSFLCLLYVILSIYCTGFEFQFEWAVPSRDRYASIATKTLSPNVWLLMGRSHGLCYGGKCLFFLRFYFWILYYYLRTTSMLNWRCLSHPTRPVTTKTLNSLSCVDICVCFVFTCVLTNGECCIRFFFQSFNYSERQISFCFCFLLYFFFADGLSGITWFTVSLYGAFVQFWRFPVKINNNNNKLIIIILIISLMLAKILKENLWVPWFVFLTALLYLLPQFLSLAALQCLELGMHQI